MPPAQTMNLDQLKEHARHQTAQIEKFRPMARLKILERDLANNLITQEDFEAEMDLIQAEMSNKSSNFRQDHCNQNHYEQSYQPMGYSGIPDGLQPVVTTVDPSINVDNLGLQMNKGMVEPLKARKYPTSNKNLKQIDFLCCKFYQPSTYFLRCWTIPTVFFVFLITSITEIWLLIILLPDSKHYFQHLLVPEVNIQVVYTFILVYTSLFWYSSYSYIKTVKRIEKHKIALKKDRSKVALFLTLNIIVTTLFTVAMIFLIYVMYFKKSTETGGNGKFEVDVVEIEETLSKYIKKPIIKNILLIG